VPDRILRWRWPRERLLRAIEVFRFEQAPRFYVRTGRLSGELSMVGFNVLNLSSFKLALVGADLQISLDSRDFYWMLTPNLAPSPPQRDTQEAMERNNSIEISGRGNRI
jgi:hypothetical protein